MGADNHGDHGNWNAEKHACHAPECAPEAKGEENYKGAEVEGVAHEFWLKEVADKYLSCGNTANNACNVPWIVEEEHG